MRGVNFKQSEADKIMIIDARGFGCPKPVMMG